MKKTTSITLLTLALGLVLFSVTGCGEKATTRDIEPESTNQAAHEPAAAAPASGGIGGKVLETMDSGGYSYVLLDMDEEEVWTAGPTTEGLAVGDFVYITGAMEMRNFHAKSLDRTFETILFVGSISKDAPQASSGGAMHGGMGGMGGMGQSDEPISGTKTKLENAGVEGVTKAEGGYTVSEIYAKAGSLANKNVTLRARVVKFSPNIMGTNWLHIQDGSGDDDTSDLTITTDGHAQVGDLVLIEGPLSVDKDFGAGYKYHVIIEGATVTKQ